MELHPQVHDDDVYDIAVPKIRSRKRLEIWPFGGLPHGLFPKVQGLTDKPTMTGDG